MAKKEIWIIVLVLVVLAVFGFLIFSGDREVSEPLVTNFEECANAGYPVMESYPRQCRVPGGELFVEQIRNSNSAVSSAINSDGCFIGGCSRELCSDQEGMVSTCEYKEEYACYQTARCERQSDGKCGWTQNPELSACLLVYYDYAEEGK